MRTVINFFIRLLGVLIALLGMGYFLPVLVGPPRPIELITSVTALVAGLYFGGLMAFAPKRFKLPPRK